MHWLNKIWSNVKPVGKMAYLFRSSAFFYQVFVIYYHHYSHQLTMEWVDYFTIIALLALPTLFLFEFYRKPKQYDLYVKHAIIDVFVVGWCAGIINLSILPSAIALMGGITNYVAMRGFRKSYRLLFIFVGGLPALALSNFEIVLTYDTVLEILSMVYGLFHFITLSYMSYYFANKFFKNNLVLKEQKTEIDRQHEEIHQQAEELKTLNSSLSELNNNLEKAVVDRTNELHVKNKKLAQYAFFNAHKLRAPLARIIGLTQLFNYRDTIKNEEENVIDLLKISADELDEIVSDINKNLEKDELIKTLLDEKER